MNILSPEISRTLAILIQEVPAVDRDRFLAMASESGSIEEFVMKFYGQKV
jgi:CRP-like cAMP-binding protein